MNLHALALVFLVATHAGSVEAGEPSYDAPEGCPDQVAFARELGRRMGPRRLSAEIRVSIAANEATYDGKLLVDGQLRELHAAACEDLVRALALAASTAADDPDPIAAPPEPSVPQPVWPAGPPPPDRVTTAPVKRPAVQLGAAAGGTTALGGMAADISLFGGFEEHGRFVRIGAGHASRDLTSSIGGAYIERWELHALGCPVSLHFGARFSPCARIDAGVLRGSGEQIRAAETQFMPWLAISAGAVLGIDVGPNFFLEGEARVAASPLREVLYVLPAETIFRSPLFSAEMGVVAGFRFPK